MQTGSSNESSRRAKTSGKATGNVTGSKTPKRAKTPATSDTLHLKAKQLVATASDEGIDVTAMIATAAYFRAAQRGFEPGHELDDWLQAEQQVRS
jgi:hypothetical protein